MTTTETKGREFEIAAQVADLLDTLPKEQQRQVMAMLAARYGLTVKEPTRCVPPPYKPKRKLS